MKCITRMLGILAGVGGALLGILITGSAALAYDVPARGGATGPPPPPVIASSGMAGWQITLIAVGAALLASVLAVVADRSWLARRHRSAASA
ncbi:MAG TPA: hypothetical protein VGH77_04295 [Streptosporangiaceae bacterium]|jgi:hypothetical protein